MKIKYSLSVIIPIKSKCYTLQSFLNQHVISLFIEHILCYTQDDHRLDYKVLLQRLSPKIKFNIT